MQTLFLTQHLVLATVLDDDTIKVCHACLHGHCFDPIMSLYVTATAAECRCSNAETQIFTLLADLDLDSGSFNATALAGYYILGEGGSLNNVSERAAGVNFAAIKTTINNTIQQTITVSSAAHDTSKSTVQRIVTVNSSVNSNCTARRQC